MSSSLSFITTTCHTATPDDAETIARILARAFNDKVQAILGKHTPNALPLMSDPLQRALQDGWDGMFLAEADGRAVGALTFEPPQIVKHYLAQAPRAFAILGWRGLARAALGALLMAYFPRRDEAYIASVGVLPEAQGRGIGRLLLQAAEQWARRKHKRRLTLFVAAHNVPAVHLYESFGMRTQHVVRSRITARFFGIGEWRYMVKELA